MRRDQHSRRVPQRVPGRQRLGVGHVERGGDAFLRQLGEQGLGVDQLAAGHVDEQRAVWQQAELARAEHALRLRRVRGDHEDHVRLWQQLVQVGGRVNQRCSAPAAAGHPGDRGDLEALQAGLDGRPDAPVANDQHPLVGEGPAGPLVPLARDLIAGEPVQVPAAGQGQGQRQLRGAGVVQPGRVAQCHLVRQQRQDVLVAGREGLHDLKSRHLPDLVEHGGALHVGQHVEGGFVGRGGEVVSVGPVEVEFQPVRYAPEPPLCFGEAGVGNPGQWHGVFLLRSVVIVAARRRAGRGRAWTPAVTTWAWDR